MVLERESEGFEERNVENSEVAGGLDVRERSKRFGRRIKTLTVEIEK